MTSTAQDDSSSHSSVRVPCDIDDNPLVLDDNPAHIDGLLYEFGLWIERTGIYLPLIENRGVALSNGKLAVEHPNSALFVNASPADPVTYSFGFPCPPIGERIRVFDDDANINGDPLFATYAVTALPDDLKVAFQPAKYTVQQEDRNFMNSLLAMFSSSSTAQTYISKCNGSGYYELLKLMRETSSKEVTPQDKVLVSTQFKSFVATGLQAELSLKAFNDYVKEFNRRHRTMPLANRMPEYEIMEMFNKIMFKDPGFSRLYEIVLNLQPPKDVEETLKSIRKMLRSREVNHELCEGTTPSGAADPLTALIAKASSDGDVARLNALVAARSAIIDPKKKPAQHPPGGGKNPGAQPPPASGENLAANATHKQKVERDKKTGRILKWVIGLDLCGCVDSAKSDGKHLIRDCKFGSRTRSEKFKFSDKSGKYVPTSQALICEIVEPELEPM